MTIIRVGLHHGKSQTMEIDKPYDKIHADDIWARDIHSIVGWVDVEEEVRQLRWQLCVQSDRIDALKAIIKELNAEIDGNHRKNRRLADDTEFAKRQMSTCKKQFDRLEKAYNDSVEQGRRQHDTIGNQRNMLADCEKTVQRLVDSNKDDRTIVDDMNKTIRDQKATINELKVSGDQRTIHLQKMRIDEQKETILRLVKEVKELRDTDDFIRKIRDQDKIIGRQHKQIREHCKTIGELRTDVGIRDKIIKILDSDAEYWRLIQDENHAFIHRLLDDNNTFNGVLDDCRADVKDRNKTIEQLEKNLHDTNIVLDKSRKIAREYHKMFTDCEKQLKMEIATVDHLDVMLTEERKGNNDWLWNKYNQLTRMVLESDITVLGKDQTIARLDRRLDKCMTHLSEYDAALKDRDKIIDEQKADLDEKSVRNNDLIKQYLLDQKEIEKLDCEIKELQKERDEYKESIKLERIDRIAEKRTVSRCYSNDLRKKNAIILEIAKDRDEWRQSTADAGAVIRRLEDREEDSKTLTKVVDIVDDDTISSIEAMCETSNVVMRAKQ